MSSPDRLSSRRATLFAGAALLTALAAGCGFTPVYAPGSAGGAGTAAALASVEIGPVATTADAQLHDEDDRAALQLTNELDFLFSRGGDPLPASYTLTTKMTLNQLDLTLASSGRATSTRVDAVATYSLTRVGDGSVVLTATSRGSATYDRSAQAFANLRAQRDAIDRSMDQLATEMWTRISAGLSVAP